MKMVEKWAKSGCTGAAARAHAWARAGAHACALAAPRATLCATRTRVCADCHAVYNAALLSWPQRPRWPMSKLAMGRKKATTAPAVVLTRIQKEKLRQRGYLYPATVKALRTLRPARGYPVVPVVQRGRGRPLAVDVCALVEQYALQARLFGNSQVECHPDDSEIRQGPMFGVLHRDCQPLRLNSRNLQFIAVLQGSVRVRMETSVAATRPACSRPRMRERSIVVTANKVFIFH